MTEKLCEMRVEAYCIDDEFEAMILETYGVRITDRAGAPWEWAFQGTRSNLLAMWLGHWGDPSDQTPDIKEIP